MTCGLPTLRNRSAPSLHFTTGIPNAVITSVAATSTPPSGSYGSGDSIEFTVTFNQAVTVEGDPQFNFSLGEVAKTARYDAGRSTTTSLVFTYTVQTGDEGHRRYLGRRWAADLHARRRRPHPYDVERHRRPSRPQRARNAVRPQGRKKQRRDPAGVGSVERSGRYGTRAQSGLHPRPPALHGNRGARGRHGHRRADDQSRSRPASPISTPATWRFPTRMRGRRAIRWL